MRLGLLQCDVVDPSFLRIDGDYSEMIHRLLEKQELKFELSTYYVHKGELPASVNECDAYIGGGARYSVFDEKEWIQKFRDFVLKLHAHKKKFIGICFSHQIIAQALGGRVKRSERGWGVGSKETRIVSLSSWMDPPVGKCRMLYSHQDQVIMLPPNASLLAKNDHCPHAMFSEGDHFLAIQAHPEYSEAYVRALCESRRGIIPAVVLEAGLASLEFPADHRLLGDWVGCFLKE